MNRYEFLKLTGSGVLGVSSVPVLAGSIGKPDVAGHGPKDVPGNEKGAQRLTIEATSTIYPVNSVSR